ncbi:MAG: hypothetical protein ACFB2Z_02420 [Maricaulaceae bacterium]
MRTHAIKNKAGHLEHSDVIRVVGHSHNSFDDAVSSAIKQLTNPKPGHNHHDGLKFVAFEVIQLSGAIEHGAEGEAGDVIHFSATIDVEAHHKHCEDDLHDP